VCHHIWLAKIVLKESLGPEDPLPSSLLRPMMPQDSSLTKPRSPQHVSWEVLVSQIFSLWRRTRSNSRVPAVILVTWEAEVEGSRSKASLYKVSMRPCLKNKPKAKGLEVWLKWQNAKART
jgi:hypothetical protein